MASLDKPDNAINRVAVIRSHPDKPIADELVITVAISSGICNGKTVCERLLRGADLPSDTSEDAFIHT